MIAENNNNNNNDKKNNNNAMIAENRQHFSFFSFLAWETYLKDFGTDSGVNLKCFGIETAPAALTLSQIPGIGSHPWTTAGDAVCIPTGSGWWQ